MTPPNTQQPKAFEKYEDHEQQEQPTLEVEDIVDSETLLYTKDQLSQLTLTIGGANTMSWLNGSLGRSLMNL